jgi:glyoxylate utilization-related uncharacterized protein
MQVFYIISGTVKVTILDSVFTLVTGSTFFVPPRECSLYTSLHSAMHSENLYSIENETSTATAKLFYTQIAEEGTPQGEY